MIEVKHLKKSFHIKGQLKTALDDINLSFPDSGLVCICGRSGSGKSTLLNLMGLQDSADSGEILYNGKNILVFRERYRNAYRRRVVGRISQDYDLIPGLTVFENCEIAAGLKGSYDTVRTSILRSLDLVDLSGYEKRKINELSGGEKQRVAIARAIAGKMPVLLCDEPTGNLDPDTSIEIMDLLKGLSKEISVIVVTHNRTLADRYADRIIDLNGGHVTSDRLLSKKTYSSVEAVSSESEDSK